MNKKVVTFGEIMLRLSPPDYKRFIQSDNFDVTYGGSEANVAVSLSNYGIDSYFVTKLPNNQIGLSAANSLRRYGVNTDSIIWGGERLGIYFAENGASQRPSLVIYDRANSAISNIDPGEINWKKVLNQKDWFHFSGITPALGVGPTNETYVAVRTAKEMGLKISCDLNYRKKLWTKRKAQSVMVELMENVDVLFGNEEDAEIIFDIKADNTNVASGELCYDSYHGVAKKLLEKFNMEKVAITLRESHTASQNSWSALLYDGSNYYQSKKYNISIVDRIGGGDSFCGALIYSILNNYEPQYCLDFAVAASCLKHTMPGDYNIVSKEEVEKLAQGDSSGRVKR